MKTKYLLLAVLAIVVAYPSLAIAGVLDMEYVTYGGFYTITTAFKAVGNITANPAYVALATFVMVPGIVVMAVRLGFGDIKSSLVWLLGICIWFGFGLSTSTMNVQDTVLNRTMSIGGVPNAICFIAGGLNAIQRQLVSIVATAGDPLGFEMSANGVGPQKLLDTATRSLTVGSTDMESTLQSYMEKCVLWEMARPGGSITKQEVFKDNTDLMPILAKGSNPFIGGVTIYSGGTYAIGQCNEAWTTLSTYYSTPATYDLMVKAICNLSVYRSSTSAADLQQCNSMISAWVTQAHGVSGVDATQYVRQVYLSNKLIETYQAGNGVSIEGYNFITGAGGSNDFYNAWAPFMREVITAFTLVLCALLLIFLPSEMVLTILQWVFGLLLFPVVWTVCDAVIHQFIVDSSNEMYAQVKQYKLGIDALTMQPEASTKLLAMWWKFQTFSAIMAGVVASIFAKTGHAAAMFAQGLGQELKRHGEQAGDAMTPGGQAGGIDRAAGSFGTIANAGSHSPAGLMNVAAHDKRVGTDATLNTINDLGGMDNSVTMQARAQEMRNVRSAHHGAQIDAGQAATLGAIDGGGDVGKANVLAPNGGTTGAAALAKEISSNQTEKTKGQMEGDKDAEVSTGISVEDQARNAARLSGEESQAGLKRLNNMGKTFGLDEYQTQELIKSGGVLSTGMVDAAASHGFSGLAPDMRVNSSSMTFDKNGDLTHLDASMDMNKKEAGQYAKWLEKIDPHAAQMLKDQMGNFKSGQSLAVTASFGKNGTLSTFVATHSASASFVDTGIQQSGLTLSPDSFNVDANAAFQAARKGGEGLNKMVSGVLSAKGDERERRIDALASSIASGGSSFMGKNTSSADVSTMGYGANAKAGLEFMGMGAGVSIDKGTSHGHTENRSRDEIAKELRGVIHTALNDPSKYPHQPASPQAAVSKGIHDYITKNFDLAQK